MNDAALQTSFWMMVLVQTIGSVDLPGSGARKMPAPRAYVAILVTWLILQLVADAGENARRAATALGWVLVLTGMVVGPFGQRFVSFLNAVASQFSNKATAAAPSAMNSGASPAEQQIPGIGQIPVVGG